MSEIPDDIRRVARDIMDNACLGEHWAKNGVDAALRRDIARAVLAERQRCAGLASSRGSPGHFMNVRSTIERAILSGEQP